MFIVVLSRSNRISSIFLSYPQELGSRGRGTGIRKRGIGETEKRREEKGIRHFATRTANKKNGGQATPEADKLGRKEPESTDGFRLQVYGIHLKSEEIMAQFIDWGMMHPPVQGRDPGQQ
jgi:hypothetical protein